MAGERRKYPRIEWIDSGRIDLAVGLPHRFCVVKDLSSHGAKLGGLDGATLPNEFTLCLSDNRWHKCRMIWRERCELEVEFDKPLTSSQDAHRKCCDPGMLRIRAPTHRRLGKIILLGAW
jgi:hypothetical protein